MELRKKYIMRLKGEDTAVIVVRDSGGRTGVETEGGERIEDALVLDSGRTVSVRRGGRMYLVDLTPPGVAVRRALVAGYGGVVDVLDELTAAAAEQGGAGSVQPELRCEMPGLVVDIKVEAGDTVELDQPVVVLEAMKMQNELGAPGAGVVQEVLVKAGESVEAGAVLLRFAPEESA